MSGTQQSPAGLAARAIRFILEAQIEGDAGERDIDVSMLRKIGEGDYRDAFAAHVRASEDTGIKPGTYIAAVPHPNAPLVVNERSEREFDVLQILNEETLPFRVPKPMGVYESGGRLTLVRTWLAGVPLTIPKTTDSGSKPWEPIAMVAAALHLLDVSDLEDEWAGHVTRRAHADAELKKLEELGPEIDDIRAWLKAHLPDDVPASLLHGDLLGQNILLEENQPPGVIDWEFAMRGDPAYDLAIVTRGHPRPFRMVGGLHKLVEHYRECGGLELTPTNVHFWELCLYARWYLSAVRNEVDHAPSKRLRTLKEIFARAFSESPV